MPPTRLPEPFEIKRSDEMIKEDKKIYEAEKKQEAEQLSMFDTPLMSEKAKRRSSSRPAHTPSP